MPSASEEPSASSGPTPGPRRTPPRADYAGSGRPAPGPRRPALARRRRRLPVPRSHSPRLPQDWIRPVEHGLADHRHPTPSYLGLRQTLCRQRASTSHTSGMPAPLSSLPSRQNCRLAATSPPFFILLFVSGWGIIVRILLVLSRGVRFLCSWNLACLTWLHAETVVLDGGYCFCDSLGLRYSFKFQL